jgi:tetratricopeptide (TPR) repeat protein
MKDRIENMETELHTREELGEMLRDLSRYVALCKQNITHWERLHGKNHEEVGFAREDLAYGYVKLGRYSKAVSEIKRALDIAQDVFGASSGHYVRCLNNLGRVYYLAGDDSNAFPLISKALEVLPSLPTEEQRSYPQALKNMASLLICQGEFEKAERLLFDAMKRQLRQFGPYDQRFANTLESLSILYLKQGRLLASERTIRKAIRISRKASTDESAEHAMMLCTFRRVSKEQGKMDDALSLHRSALKILRRVRPEGHFQIVNVEKSISEILGKR